MKQFKISLILLLLSSVCSQAVMLDEGGYNLDTTPEPDGMSDIWQFYYNFNYSTADAWFASDDQDGDGYRNDEESIAGTNPFDVNDKLDFIDGFGPKKINEGAKFESHEIAFRAKPHIKYIVRARESNSSVFRNIASFTAFVDDEVQVVEGYEDSLEEYSLSYNTYGETCFHEIIVNISTTDSISFVEYQLAIEQSGDTDGDGLNDYEEYLSGLDPYSKDSNQDGVSDYDEVLDYLFPTKAVINYPSNSANYINLDTLLSWERGVDSYGDTASSLILIWKTNESEDQAIKINADSSSSILLSQYSTVLGLEAEETYKWRVDSYNQYGLTKGDEWKFTTVPKSGENYEDMDYDGIPDYWEDENGLDPSYDDSILDLDGDGISNASEWILGSDPNRVINIPTSSRSLKLEVLSDDQDIKLYLNGEELTDEAPMVACELDSKYMHAFYFKINKRTGSSRFELRVISNSSYRIRFHGDHVNPDISSSTENGYNTYDYKRYTVIDGLKSPQILGYGSQIYSINTEEKYFVGRKFDPSYKFENLSQASEFLFEPGFYMTLPVGNLPDGSSIGDLIIESDTYTNSLNDLLSMEHVFFKQHNISSDKYISNRINELEHKQIYTEDALICFEPVRDEVWNGFSISYYDSSLAELREGSEGSWYEPVGDPHLKYVFTKYEDSEHESILIEKIIDGRTYYTTVSYIDNLYQDTSILTEEEQSLWAVEEDDSDDLKTEKLSTLSSDYAYVYYFWGMNPPQGDPMRVITVREEQMDRSSTYLDTNEIPKFAQARQIAVSDSECYKANSLDYFTISTVNNMDPLATFEASYQDDFNFAMMASARRPLTTQRHGIIWGTGKNSAMKMSDHRFYDYGATYYQTDRSEIVNQKYKTYNSMSGENKIYKAPVGNLDVINILSKTFKDFEEFIYDSENDIQAFSTRNKKYEITHVNSEDKLFTFNIEIDDLDLKTSASLDVFSYYIPFTERGSNGLSPERYDIRTSYNGQDVSIEKVSNITPLVHSGIRVAKYTRYAEYPYTNKPLFEISENDQITFYEYEEDEDGIVTSSTYYGSTKNITGSHLYKDIGDSISNNKGDSGKGIDARVENYKIYLLAHKSTKLEVVRNIKGQVEKEISYICTGNNSFERLTSTTYSYDKYGNVILKRKSDGSYLKNSYENGVLTRTVSDAGETRQFYYDGLGRVKTEVLLGKVNDSGEYYSVPNMTIHKEYDTMDRVIHLELGNVKGDSNNIVTKWEYHPGGKVKSLTTFANSAYPATTTYHYNPQDDDGGIERITFPDGSTKVIRHYNDGRKKNVSIRNGEGSIVVDEFYDYEVLANGLIRNIKEIETADGLSRVSVQDLDYMGLLSGTLVQSAKNTNESSNDFYLKTKYEGEYEEDENKHKRPQAELTLITSEDNEFVSSDLKPVVYIYNDYGELLKKGIDMDYEADNPDYTPDLTPNSDDRYEEYNQSYQKADGIWWEVKTVQKPKLDGSGMVTVAEEWIQASFPTTAYIHLTKTYAGSSGSVEPIITKVSKYPSEGERRVETFYPGVETPQTQITVNGLVVREDKASGVRIIQKYNQYGQLILKKGTRGEETQFIYYPGTTLLHKAQKRDESMQWYDVAEIEYDKKMHRVLWEKNASGHYTRYAYNDLGLVTHIWGDAVHPIKNVYNGFGERIELHQFREGDNWDSESWPSENEENDAADITRWELDENTGLMTAKIDPTGMKTCFEYDDFNRLHRRYLAVKEGGSDTAGYAEYTYDQNTSELLNITYYNADGSTDLNTPAITYTYNKNGSISTVTDITGTREFKYRETDFLPEYEQLGDYYTAGSMDVYLRNKYDAYKRNVGLTLGTQENADLYQDITYAYNANNGMLSQIISKLQDGDDDRMDIHSYKYHDNSSLVSESSNEIGASNFTIYSGYETHRNMMNERGNIYNGQNYATYSKTRDNRGKVIDELRTGSLFSNYYTGQLNLNYSYSNQAELTEVEVYEEGSYYRKWEYDNAGNREASWKESKRDEAKVTYESNAANQYTSISSFGSPLQYDPNGNMEFDGELDYTYDGENRVIKIEAQINGILQTLEYTYDYLNRRVEEVYLKDSVEQHRKRYIYQGYLLIAQMDIRDLNAQDLSCEVTYEKSFVWGLDRTGTLNGAGSIGGLILIEDSDGATYIPGYDGMGNVSMLVSAQTGEKVAEFVYSPYGTLLLENDVNDITPFRYQTKWQINIAIDSEDAFHSDIYDFSQRLYHVEQGRFVNKDPIAEEGGNNLYAYVGNDPINQWDYLGYSPERETSKDDAIIASTEAETTANLGKKEKVDDAKKESQKNDDKETVTDQDIQKSLSEDINPSGMSKSLDAHSKNITKAATENLKELVENVYSVLSMSQERLNSYLEKNAVFYDPETGEKINTKTGENEGSAQNTSQEEETGDGGGGNLFGKAWNGVKTGAKALYNKATAWHFEGRQVKNGNHPTFADVTTEGSKWKLLPADQSIYHDNKTGEPELKYIHPDGREAVFTMDGTESGGYEPYLDAEYMPTYNYVNPAPKPSNAFDVGGWINYGAKGAGHVITDVVPYYFGGNVRGEN